MCVCVCVDDMVRNARRTHEKRKWTANVERASDRRRTQTNKREIIAKSIENQPQNPSKIDPKSTKNRCKIALGLLGGDLGRLGALPGRSGGASGALLDALGTSWGAPEGLLARSGALPGRPGALPGRVRMRFLRSLGADPIF